MNAVRCEGLCKRYRIRASMRRAIGELLGGGHGRAGGQFGAGYFWALQDFTLGVQQGDALGVIGDNGAGKSTLLKVVAGVTYPTSGRVEVRGRVGALVDVGAGVVQELTGRENIYQYGTMLGLPRRETKKKFESIVDFAELHEFLDVPMKRYSSGMKVRLGFAVAAHLDPDILLVDEVLAVGDVSFQRKCVAHLRGLHEAGTTIIFVSHDLPAVEQLCHRTAWINGGRIREVGRSSEVIQHYRAVAEQEFLGAAGGGVKSVGSLEVERVVLTDARGVERSEFEPGESITINLYYRVPERQLSSQIVFKIIDDEHTILSVAHSHAQERELVLTDRGVVRCTFEALPLAAKTYQVWGRVLRIPEYREEVPWQAMAAFAMTGARQVVSGATDAPYEWELPVLQIPTRWEFDGVHGPTQDETPRSRVARPGPTPC